MKDGIVCTGKCDVKDCPYKIRRELMTEAIYVDLRYTTMCKEASDEKNEHIR